MSPHINPPLLPTPVVSVSIDPSTLRESRSYQMWVDLVARIDPISRRATISGEIHTYLPLADVGSFTDDLVTYKLLKYYIMSMKDMGQAERLRAVRFRPKMAETYTSAPYLIPELSRSLLTMLRLLERRKYPIIWKEGKHGYLIDCSGKIERRWDLDPF